MFVKIDVAELYRLKGEGPVTVIDVRTEMEVARCHIEGARHIPLQTLPLRTGEIDRQVPAVLYCQSGGRSAQACAYLAANGFRNLHNLEGGIIAWVRSGFPLGIPV